MKTAYIAKQRQVSFVKSHFSRQLEEKLGQIEVQAPILSRVGDGTQDNLSGCEKAVQVKVKTLPDSYIKPSKDACPIGRHRQECLPRNFHLSAPFIF